MSFMHITHTYCCKMHIPRIYAFSYFSSRHVAIKFKGFSLVFLGDFYDRFLRTVCVGDKGQKCDNEKSAQHNPKNAITITFFFFDCAFCVRLLSAE